jgi:hypothetical protein
VKRTTWHQIGHAFVSPALLLLHVFDFTPVLPITVQSMLKSKGFDPLWSV